jgi:hypothetical protein
MAQVITIKSKSTGEVKTIGARKPTLIEFAADCTGRFARWVEVLSANQDGSAEMSEALKVAKKAAAKSITP